MIRRGFLAAVVAAAAALAAVGCGGGGGEARTVTLPTGSRYRAIDRPAQAKPADYATVKRIVDRYGGRLRERYDGVVGYGVGSSRDRRAPKRAEVYLIVVLLERARDLPRRPQALHGIPLEFKATGPIRAL